MMVKPSHMRSNNTRVKSSHHTMHMIHIHCIKIPNPTRKK